MSKVNTKLTALIAPLSLAAGLAITTSAYAGDAEYLSDSQGENVVNSYEECWEVSYGLPTCGEELYTISGSGLFDFDKATLRPEGRTRIARLGTDLDNVSYDSVDVTGHTDPIGSDAYNQDLSQRRADSVRTELVQEGVPSGRINAQGVGETQLKVTPQDCAGARNRAALIEGYQPNRRVDVSVYGVTTK